MTMTMTTETAAVERIAQRITTARDICQMLHPAAFGPLEETQLVSTARRTYARAAVWLGQDAAVLADDAEALFNDEEADHDGDPIGAQDVEDTDAPVEQVEQARRFLTQWGAPAEPCDHEQARTLCTEILASLMHAARAAHGDPYAVYDAAEAFADIHHDPQG